MECGKRSVCRGKYFRFKGLRGRLPPFVGLPRGPLEDWAFGLEGATISSHSRNEPTGFWNL